MLSVQSPFKFLSVIILVNHYLDRSARALSRGTCYFSKRWLGWTNHSSLWFTAYGFFFKKNNCVEIAGTGIIFHLEVFLLPTYLNNYTFNCRNVFKKAKTLQRCVCYSVENRFSEPWSAPSWKNTNCMGTTFNGQRASSPLWEQKMSTLKEK